MAPLSPAHTSTAAGHRSGRLDHLALECDRSPTLSVRVRDASGVVDVVRNERLAESEVEGRQNALVVDADEVEETRRIFGLKFF